MNKITIMNRSTLLLVLSLFFMQSNVKADFQPDDWNSLEHEISDNLTHYEGIMKTLHSDTSVQISDYKKANQESGAYTDFCAFVLNNSEDKSEFETAKEEIAKEFFGEQYKEHMKEFEKSDWKPNEQITALCAAVLNSYGTGYTGKKLEDVIKVTKAWRCLEILTQKVDINKVLENITLRNLLIRIILTPKNGSNADNSEAKKMFLKRVNGIDSSNRVFSELRIVIDAYRYVNAEKQTDPVFSKEDKLIEALSPYFDDLVKNKNNDEIEIALGMLFSMVDFSSFSGSLVKLASQNVAIDPVAIPRENTIEKLSLLLPVLKNTTATGNLVEHIMQQLKRTQESSENNQTAKVKGGYISGNIQAKIDELNETQKKLPYFSPRLAIAVMHHARKSDLPNIIPEIIDLLSFEDTVLNSDILELCRSSMMLNEENRSLLINAVTRYFSANAIYEKATENLEKWFDILRIDELKVTKKSFSYILRSLRRTCNKIFGLRVDSVSIAVVKEVISILRDRMRRKTLAISAEVLESRLSKLLQNKLKKSEESLEDSEGEESENILLQKSISLLTTGEASSNNEKIMQFLLENNKNKNSNSDSSEESDEKDED